MSEKSASIHIKNVDVFYGTHHVLKNINMTIQKNAITAFIGPSGCGKTTLLKSINRMNDFISDFKLSGNILVDEEDIYQSDKQQYLIELRRKIGLVFQMPNPFRTSIYDNLSMPILEKTPKIPTTEMNKIILKALECTHIYEEVKERLHMSAEKLSGGQQQRLCIARALAIEPEVILFDEPCSALDPISTLKIEDLLGELKKNYTIIIVTHNMEQAARIADYVGFFYEGELVEYDTCNKLFDVPDKELTQRYISGKFS
ncbi:phosphate ABC transporter ATP-binding protein PstB [Cellulosilyticum sp. I15G10I2]|uniref:phosphate ABC transporter ATP-binding protein PstB n=1 Tax=Cellulosilyticum sp. I15G10I2 TaxID=1892843 RepID=UPI00085CC66A|nr:phosphate ABC transporter ATP-binding protein PstB [Cellulosilyticum sp. I15G10I2]